MRILVTSTKYISKIHSYNIMYEEYDPISQNQRKLGPQILWQDVLCEFGAPNFIFILLNGNKPNTCQASTYNLM